MQIHGCPVCNRPFGHQSKEGEGGKAQQSGIGPDELRAAARLYCSPPISQASNGIAQRLHRMSMPAVSERSLRAVPPCWSMRLAAPAPSSPPALQQPWKKLMMG